MDGRFLVDDGDVFVMRVTGLVDLGEGVAAEAGEEGVCERHCVTLLDFRFWGWCCEKVRVWERSNLREEESKSGCSVSQGNTMWKAEGGAVKRRE